jgi:hypothetical protein
VWGLTLSLDAPGVSTAHEIWVTPGQIFDVEVNLDADYQLYALDAVLEASESDVFTVLALATSWPWHARGMTPVDPTSTRLGWNIPFPGYFGPGTSVLGTMGIVVAPTAPASAYVINFSEITVSPNRIEPYMRAGTPGEGFVVHVVPEPASLLICLALAGVVVRRRA